MKNIHCHVNEEIMCLMYSIAFDSEITDQIRPSPLACCIHRITSLQSFTRHNCAPSGMDSISSFQNSFPPQALSRMSNDISSWASSRLQTRLFHSYSPKRRTGMGRAALTHCNTFSDESSMSSFAPRLWQTWRIAPCVTLWNLHLYHSPAIYSS